MNEDKVKEKKENQKTEGKHFLIDKREDKWKRKIKKKQEGK